MRRPNSLSTWALIGALLWGAIELLALLRSRWSDPGHPRNGWNVRGDR